MKTITVKPVPGGWIVIQDAELALAFRAGGRAEQKARELAELARRAGEATRVIVHDLSGALIAQLRYEVVEAV